MTLKRASERPEDPWGPMTKIRPDRTRTLLLHATEKQKNDKAYQQLCRDSGITSAYIPASDPGDECDRPCCAT